MARKKVPEKRKELRITWKHSAIGRAGVQKRTIAALGLRRLNQTVTHLDTPAIRGMVKRVGHLVEVKEV